MKPIVSVLALFCLSAFAQVADKPAPAPVAPAAAPQPASASAASSVQQRHVAVLVCATDAAGRPVSGLAKDQITVLDNQQSGQILDVSSTSQLPLDLGIVLLASQGTFAQQQAAAVELVREVLRPNVDKAFVVAAGGSKPWPNPNLDWQTDADALGKTILTLDKDAGLPDSFTGFSVFNILWPMMQSDPRPARHVVVIFRDAWAHSPGFITPAEQLHLIQQAQHLWISFYVIGLKEQPQTSTYVAAPPGSFSSKILSVTGDSGGEGIRRGMTGRDGVGLEVNAPPVTPTQSASHQAYQNSQGLGGQPSYQNGKAGELAMNAGRSNLQHLAEETGGAIWWSTKKNFFDTVANISGALAGQYAVTYAVPADPSAGPEHLLLVKANDASTHIAAQKVYFSRQAQPQPASTKPPQ